MPKKLLLAEDSLTIQKVFELAFARSDVSITTVDNGNDAVRLAGEISPDLVVADVTLPGRDGYAVAADLRAAEKTRDIPVLILSGSLIPLDEQRFRTSRANDVLFKPFDSQEMMEKVEGLFRKGAEAPAAVERGFPAPPVAEATLPIEEHWDFSDVLEEVEGESGKAAAPEAPAVSLKREEILPGSILAGGGPSPGAFLNEYDVSVEEVAGENAPVERVAPPPPPETHLEGSLAGDAPPAVTDLSPALEPEEKIGDLEELEELEELEGLEAPPEAPPARLAGFSPLQEIPAVTAPEEFHPPPPPATPVPPVVSAPPPGEEAPLGAALREQFAARAEEIFRTVATEAVEKVMGEMLDRLAADFSAKVRESVEAVAWEVIPATAEALIREEIARIRQQAGKLSH